MDGSYDMKKKAPRINRGAFLTLPSAGMLLCMTIVPLCMLLVFMFMNRNMFPGQPWPGWTMANITRVFSSKTFWKLMLKSLGMSGIVTTACILIGYPAAWGIAKYIKPQHRTIFMMLVILPFFTSQLLLFYSMINLIRNGGLLMTMFESLNIHVESIMYSDKATILLLIYAYLPYMILCLYSSVEAIDQDLIHASLSLGAGIFRTFTNIVFPMSVPGLLSGILLVFVPVTGSFEVAELVGGSGGIMVGSVINAQYKDTLNMGYGAVLACVLLVVLSLIMALVSALTTHAQKKIGGDVDA